MKESEMKSSRPRLSAKAGFTLVEMLSVVLLISILMASAGMSVRKANHLAKNAKAEAECRELVNAMLEYHSLYGKWPGDKKGEVPATADVLKSLINSAENDRGIVFLNLTMTDSTWNDPWGQPYHIFFHDGSGQDPRETALESCVAFPYRRPALQVGE